MEETTKIEEKEEPRSSNAMVDMDAMLQMSAQMSEMSTQLPTQFKDTYVAVRNVVVPAVRKVVRSARCTYMRTGVLTIIRAGCRDIAGSLTNSRSVLTDLGRAGKN